MSVISQSAGPAREPRRLSCARCGTAFECGVGTGHCWCAEEDFRLPMPADSGEDCLCQGCLRKAAAHSGVIIREGG